MINRSAAAAVLRNAVTLRETQSSDPEAWVVAASAVGRNSGCNVGYFMNASPLLSIYVSVRELDFWITPLCMLHPERRSWGCPGIPRPESSLVYGIMRRGTTITVVLPEPLCRLSGNRRTEDVRTQHFSISGFTKLEYRTSPFYTTSALPVLPPL